MKIALVHDYLREYGGAERVVEAFHEIWPNAPLYTSFVDWDALGEHAERFREWDIRTSWVQHNPVMLRLHSPLRFLARRVWESFDLSGYDVVLTSSGWFICRGVIVKPPSVHICYIHHPPRNLYGYATGSTFQKYWPVRLYAGVINFYMRQYDFETAQKVDHFIANSQETARRVKKFYRRDSTVIYPPIRTSNLKPRTSKRHYYLSVGRLAWAKRLDVVIRAANELAIPLKIVGTGSEEQALRAIAGPTIEFLGSVSDEALSELYAGAKALIFCALDEDFGMVPVEAMAHGTPVIGLSQGGVRETVINGKTGVLFDEATPESLVGAIQRFKGSGIKGDACIKHARKFSVDAFKRSINAFVQSVRSNRV